MTKRILVTGENGFIATHLIKRLKQLGYDVNPNDFKGYDEVYHLGAKVNTSFHQNKNALMNNIGSMIALVTRFQKTQTKILFTSTNEVNYIDQLEADRYAYAFSKRAGEVLLENYIHNFVIVRLGNVYGEGMKETTVIPTILKKIKNGEKQIEIQNPDDKRSFCYVSDIVEGLIKAMEAQKTNGLTVPLGSAESISLRKLTEIIQQALGLVDVTFDYHIKRFTNEYRSVDTAMMNKLGWQSKVSLAEGLLRTYQSL